MMKNTAKTSDGGQPGLGEVHAVHRQQEGAQEGQGTALEQLLAQQVHEGHHEHPEQGGHEAPAERGHAEEPQSQHDQHFAQGRVGVFVDVFGAGQHFIGGAAVVDLVEVHAVQASGAGRNGFLFVHQGLGIPF